MRLWLPCGNAAKMHHMFGARFAQNILIGLRIHTYTALPRKGLDFRAVVTEECG